ncbi:hypothetical protein POH93_11930 [Phytobacter diazotrophicus]|uniref:DUF7079 family protein n=1 Tax=Phytobacter diazotrophicus TaxID=395631 RepID=UPI00232CAA27|nr:hypothetical protein [Phytobacter diazotrophicus]MDC0726098.1 hypothetical protein [Phytobacter diazotrophicus]MDC0733462.1 hypothetical protein [Phytobacter diazotrophicus]
MHIAESALASRVPVWYALSELFTGRELQDYDYRWMAQVIKESGLSRETIFVILDEEVAPALQANIIYNPTPVMEGWSVEDIKKLVAEYIKKKPTIIERIIPARLLLKQRRKHIQYELNRLLVELDKCT